GIRSLAKRGVFIKNPDAMERMGTIDTLIFDKTGTLSFHDREKIQWLGDVLSGEEKTLIASTAHQSGHPSSHAIAHYLNANLLDPDDFEETTGKGVTARFGQQQIQLGSADFVGAESREKARVFVAIDGEVRGFFSWKSQYRSGIDEMLHKLSKSYPIALLSGDTDTERPALLKLFEGWKDLWFKQKPDEKMNIVENWQLEGKRVLMAGDGLNDSAALQTAWFGLAVSENTQAFGPSSDGIIQADALPHLPEILQYAKKLQQVTRESLRISLIYNVLGLSFALAGVLTPIYCAILMPLSSVSVVAYVVLRERAVHAVIMGQRKKIPQKPATAFAASS
ncbi:MAG: cation-translocating P-type ATPase, partial [Cryomorphaceae bacterium]|nr:cation-translocating P-type ATPase [Cryomorphaceae bacterium]